MMVNWTRAQDLAEAREATLHDCQMRVEPSGRVWHWFCADRCGHILGDGVAISRTEAEDAAEGDYFACHPVGGPWFEHRCGNCMPLPH